jgi:hypothetical protein
MAQRKIKLYPKGAATLYPKGWPSNMRATLFLNKQRRDRFLPPIEQGQAWATTVWYQVGDTVVYSTVTYSCITTHQARTGMEPNTAAAYWAEVV